MSISSLGGGSANSLLLQQLLSAFSSNAVDATDEDESAGSADSAGQPSALSATSPSPAADGQPSDLFSSDTLGALMASQVAGSTSTSATSLLDATSGAVTDAAGVSSPPASAVSALDPNGTGGLSLSDLTEGLEQAMALSASPPGASADAAAASASAPGSDPTTSSTTTSSSSDGATSTAAPTSDQQIAGMLASLMLQYANASYSSQAQAATATTAAATSITA